MKFIIRIKNTGIPNDEETGIAGFSASRFMVQWTSLSKAKKFKSVAAAQEFIDTYKNTGAGLEESNCEIIPA